MKLLENTVRHASDLPSLPQFVYAKLHHAILTGAILPGTVLRQESIGERLGVSRVPVREALARLETEGLVVSRARRGFVVASLELDEVAEIYELRAMLEERAGALAATKRTLRDVVEVEGLLRQMEGMTINTTEDVALFLVHNRHFHDRLFQCSQSMHTCRMLLNLRNNVERCIHMGTWMVGTLEHGHVDHHRIFEAFRAGDPEATGRLSRQHVTDTASRLIHLLRSHDTKIAQLPREDGLSGLS
jgi:DNA-binding GntR family transcriptional regulator